MSAQQRINFIILGPAMTSGDTVLDAIHALYFLPDYFKLMLIGSKHASPAFLAEIHQLIKHDGLKDRVQFDGDIDTTHAVILPNAGMSRVRNSVAGDSPEALASAILDLVRTRV